MESASPSSAGKMMPSAGTGGKPSSMNGLVRTNLPQQQLPLYYNGGKGNPASGNSSGYSMMITHSDQTSQQWIASQQPIRYPAHAGKPMAYAQPSISYGGDSCIIRQQIPAIPSSPSYAYTSNTGKQSKVNQLFD